MRPSSPRHPLPRPLVTAPRLPTPAPLTLLSRLPSPRPQKSKSRAFAYLKKNAFQTDGRIDGRMDRPSYSDAWTHQKTVEDGKAKFFHAILKK